MMKKKMIITGAVLVVLSFLQPIDVSAQTSQDRPRDEKPPSIEELFKMMDENKDGKLGMAEVKGPLKNEFKKIDTNADGFITKKEMKKAPKPKRQGPPKKD